MSFQDFHSIEVFWVRKSFLSMKNQTSFLFFKHKAFFPSTSNFFFHRIPWDTIFHHELQKAYFHPNLMKDISKLNETCFFMILNENLIIWIHVQFFNFWSNFHRPHMILVVHPVCQVCDFKHFLNSNSHEKQKLSRKILKICNQASKKSFITSNFQAIFLWLITFLDH